MKKKILSNNSDEFLVDLQRVTEVMVFAEATGEFFKIYKKDAKKAGCERKIHYMLTRAIYKVEREVMVIL